MVGDLAALSKAMVAVLATYPQAHCRAILGDESLAHYSLSWWARYALLPLWRPPN